MAAATAFNFVGGYAQSHWQDAKQAGDSVGMAMWKEGGIARTAMHALFGGAISSATGGDFKTGAVAAGASQAMAGALNSAFDDQPQLRQAFSQIVGLTASGLAGGDVEKASWVALMADQYNRQLHLKETVALEKLQKESPEKAYELKAAACALVHCSESVPPDDPNYKDIKALENAGKGFKDAQGALFATGAFDEYSKWDQVNDELLRNDKNLRQSTNASRAVLGAIGAAAGFGGAVLSSPACVTAIGCAIPAMSSLGGAASFMDGWQATGQLFAPYEYTQGSKVLASFGSETYPGDVNPLRDYGTEAAKAALEIALLKGAGKYLERTGSSVLVSGVNKEAALVTDGTKGANTDKTILTGFETGNGLKPKTGDNLAESLEAERQIDGAKVSSYIPAPGDHDFNGPIPVSPSKTASSWQGSGAYVGVDKYTDTTVRDGTLVVGAVPGQSPYYTTIRGFERSGGTAKGYYEGLQIQPNSPNSTYPPYRNGVTIYKVNGDVNVGVGNALENPQFGVGGLEQVFIPNFENVLVPLYSIPFRK